MLVASTAVVVCAYQLTGISLAFAARGDAWGVLNRIQLPYFLRFAIGLAALDLGDYASHRLYHRFGTLWRVHRVHHLETDLDLTTGLRFHPVEALVTQGLLLVTIVVLGVPPAAVAFNALMVVFQNFFTHANLHVPETLDWILRKIIVTPGMHRVHHSAQSLEQDTNFGTIFSLWDRLFGTYSPGHFVNMQPPRFGLAENPDGSRMHALGLLTDPFRR